MARVLLSESLHLFNLPSELSHVLLWFNNYLISPHIMGLLNSNSHKGRIIFLIGYDWQWQLVKRSAKCRKQRKHGCVGGGIGEIIGNRGGTVVLEGTGGRAKSLKIFFYVERCYNHAFQHRQALSISYLASWWTFYECFFHGV